MNRFKKVPVINDDGFTLAESVAIFHYLGRKRIIPERWYPSDVRSRMKIDEYLQWNHNNLLAAAGLLFRTTFVLQVDDEALIAQQKRTLVGILNVLENVWLCDKKFLVGSEITFPDLMAASVLEQVIGIKLFKVDAQIYPRISKWLDEVRKFFGPTYQEAHKYVYKYGENRAPMY